MTSPSTHTSVKPSPFPVGSEWRRWDLHIHTPESKLGDSFVGVEWADYVNELEQAAVRDSIAVIGVTDYMTIDGYEKLHHAKAIDGRLDSVRLLIPNVELRMMPSTADAKALNIHLLIDPSDPNHIYEIKRALKNLQYEYNNKRYGCIRQELIEFARVQQALVNDDAAYAYGIMQFKPDRSTIMKWLAGEQWLLKNSILGITNGSDGISGLPLDGFGAVRDEILRNCQFVFSGNPADRKHYLGLKESTPADEVIQMYGSLKPCLHGSDAHELGKLFKPDHDRFCWIKADPTFEGLRQVLWEPAERVHIGPQHRQPADASKVIKTITIKNHRGWFAQEALDLNHGLVSVVGEKGTGKTAITDLIAMASGIAPEENSQASFINKGKVHLTGVGVTLTWGNGATTDALLPETPHNTGTPLVRYLSQDFVERLCSQDIDGDELQREIEDVIFNKLSEEQKEGYSSFRELRAARETSSVARREKYRGELATLNKEIARLRNLLAEKPGKDRARLEAEGQLDELNKQIPDATKTIDPKLLAELDGLIAKRKALEDEMNTLSRRRRVIEDALKSYQDLKLDVSARIARLLETLDQVGIAKTTTAKLSPQWDDSVIDLLLAEIELIDQAIGKLRGTDDDVEGTSTWLGFGRAISKLQADVSQDEVSRKRLLDLQKAIGDRKTNAVRLANEIKELDTQIAGQLSKSEAERLALYLKFFESLRDDEQGLQELYAPMQQAIERIGAKDQFSIAVGYTVGQVDWLSSSVRFYDNRKSGCEKMRDDIRRVVESELGPAWKSGSKDRIKAAFAAFNNVVDTPTFIPEYGSSKLSLVELYDWMYSIDHVSLTYKLQYSGTELEYLSPGTRGIALLVLYLLMDEDDNRPLVIDQPEGNLDSSSVYKQLVPYMWEAKKRRQIILITHNPNLVVATDSEQVIVATASRPTDQPFPCLSYTAGSLEHTAPHPDLGVREAVCTLLEGGKAAFRVREEQYALQR